MHYIGLISGTSMDAIDCALVEITDTEIALVDYLQSPLDLEIKHLLSSVNNKSSLENTTRLDVILGKLFAEAASTICSKNRFDRSQVRAIGCHGQTILHRTTGTEPTSTQIGDPNIIATQTGIDTVTDFRRMDIAHGGQGAPFAPVIHEALFRMEEKDLVVVNIGGMANITILPSGKSGRSVYGFDTGPGNVLLDEWTRLHHEQEYDRDGNWAKAGKVDRALLEQMLAYEYFYMTPPKSTGRDEFNLNWLKKQLESYRGKLSNVDVQTTLVELTAVSIGSMINDHAATAEDIILCGGGAHNRFLMERLAFCLPDRKLKTARDYGYNPDAIEAMCFAWLAKLRIENIPVSVSSVTGADKNAVLGAIYSSVVKD